MIQNLILDILFPKKCPGCLKMINDDSNFCQQCLNKIIIYQNLFCASCGSRLPNFKKICHKQEKFIFGAATSYNQIIHDAIHLLKFNFASCVTIPLTNLLISYFNTLLKNNSIDLKNFIVIPIPLSLKRLKERGFNQSELIAKIFAEALNLPLILNVLIRIKNSKPQSELKNIEERIQNVSGCFKAINPRLIRNKNVILIDDVITSGSTMREAAITLKSAGVKKIISLAIAKA